MDFSTPAGLDTAALAEPALSSAPVQADVAIVGGGLSGALLALVLARRGVSVAVADLHPSYKSDFRCEKVSAEQIALMQGLGVIDAVQGALPPGAGLIERGFRYDQVVNAVRAAWPDTVTFLTGRVNDITPRDGGGDGALQRLVSTGGDLAHARLAVLATGPSPQLAARLGLTRRVVREQHSLCLGFSLAPGAHGAFDFDGLIHPGERAGDHVGFVSLFPQGDAMRVNLFSYHDPREPWVRYAKHDPLAAVLAIAPGLAPRLRGAEVVEPPEVRVTDLYRMEGHLRPGLVLIGDAFQTSCPSTAFGVTRLLTDIDRLANTHLPAWLATPGMGADKIAAFYADPVKVALDARALAKAEAVRAMATQTGPAWLARRAAVALKRRVVTLAANGAARRERPPLLLRGDWVEVRSAVEIAATLDAEGRLDALPFMPEMAALVGRRLQVYRRSDKTCVEGHGLRAMRDTVLLDEARCDGAAHDGCERQCLMLWKEAWLRPLDAPARAVDPAMEARARQRLESLPTRDGEIYLCQSTGLLQATQVLPGWNVAHLIDDLRRGELSLARLAEIAARHTINMALARLGLGELGSLKGQDGKAVARLDLKPGERVRIKPAPELAATLDAKGCNRGLTFEPEMAAYTGRVYTVVGPVRRIIAETTGRMVEMKSTVALEGVACQGRCTRNCPRSSPLYWRETWLDRVVED